MIQLLNYQKRYNNFVNNIDKLSSLICHNITSYVQDSFSSSFWNIFIEVNTDKSMYVVGLKDF